MDGSVPSTRAWIERSAARGMKSCRPAQAPCRRESGPGGSRSSSAWTLRRYARIGASVRSSRLVTAPVALPVARARRSSRHEASSRSRERGRTMRQLTIPISAATSAPRHRRAATASLEGGGAFWAAALHGRTSFDYLVASPAHEKRDLQPLARARGRGSEISEPSLGFSVHGRLRPAGARWITSVGAGENFVSPC